MYLEKKTYVRNWSHMKAVDLHHVAVLKGDKYVDHIKPERVSYITEQVAYWRKANQIHHWFINHCSTRGEDDTYAYVSHSDLVELLDTCKRVLAASKLVEGKINNGYTYESGAKKPIIADGKIIEDSSLAQELLPTTDGFFSGSTDYDEYYLDDIKRTIEQLEPLLAEGEFDYEYEASY